MTTEDKIKEIIFEQLVEHYGNNKNKVADDLTPEHNLADDLGADSLDIVELTMALEEAFDIEISQEQADSFITVGRLLEFAAENNL